MKPTNRISRIATIGYSLYFLLETIIYPIFTKVSPVLSNILNTIYVASFIAIAAWIISLDNTLRKPAIFIIIATMFGIGNRVVLFCFQVDPRMDATTFSLLSATFYLPHLIFACIGFFKLAKGLPKGNLARGMATLIPWCELAPLIISYIFAIVMVFTTISSAILRYSNAIASMAEIIAMILLCHFLPKAIEMKNNCHKTLEQ